MRTLFLAISSVVPVFAVLSGFPEAALGLALSMAVAEAGSLFASEMYYISAAAELNDARRKALRHMAWLLLIVGAALAWLTANVFGIAAAAYMVLRLLIENCAVGGAKGAARPVIDASLLKALPEALLLRGVYVIPAAGLLAGLWFGAHINTVLPYAVGLALYGVLRVYNPPRGAEIERFGARWVLAALVTAVCAGLGFNGVFSAVYCFWAALCALLPVQRNARAWLCALLVAVQLALSVSSALLGMAWLGWCAFAAVPLAAWGQKNALYAAYLPLRAQRIRRKARR